MDATAIKLVKWKDAPGVANQAAFAAAHDLVADLKSTGGSSDKARFKKNSAWVNRHVSETASDAHQTNERVAGKQGLSKPFSWVPPETVPIVIMSKA